MKITYVCYFMCNSPGSTIVDIQATFDRVLTPEEQAAVLEAITANNSINIGGTLINVTGYNILDAEGNYGMHKYIYSIIIYITVNNRRPRIC